MLLYKFGFCENKNNKENHMQKTMKTTALVASLLSTDITFTASASAQEIEELIITATKLQKNIEDIGASIVVISGAQLNNSDGAEDLAQHLSGVQTAVSNGSQATFQVRGIGAVDHQALTPTATAVYIDGVYLATNVQTSSLLFDLERAEVLKGPQGSLYGRNASAGAINFISVRPTHTNTGYVEAEYGNFDRYNIKGAINTPINDQLAIRLSGRYLSQGASLKNVVTNDDITAPKDAGGKRDEFGMRALVELKPSADTDILFNYHYAEDNGINVAPLNSGLTTLGKHEISVGPDGIQDTDNEFFGTSLELNHRFNEVSLFILGAFEGYNQQYGFDFDGTPAPFNITSLNSNLAYDRNFSQYSLETRLSYINQSVEIMAGAYYGTEDFDQEYLIWCGDLNKETLLGTCPYVGTAGRVGPNPASDTLAKSLQSLMDQSRTTIAAFTHNTVKISPVVDLVVGGRLTYEAIKGSGEGRHIYDDGTAAFNNRDNLGLAFGSNEINETYFTGNIGLNYMLSDDVMLYSSYSNGFKSGGFNGEVINNATHFTDDGLFQAETVNSFEAGLKTSGESVRYSVTGFYQNYNQPQARIFVPFSLAEGGSFTSNSLSNLDSASSYGAELDITWVPITGLDIGGSLTLIDTKISQKINPDVPQNAETFDGNQLPFASKFSATFFAQYKWDITSNAVASIAANGKHQSSFFLDAEGRDDRSQKAYTILDVVTRLDFDSGLSVKLWAKNITNSDYAVSGYGFIGYNTFLGSPRSYGLSVGYVY